MSLSAIIDFTANVANKENSNTKIQLILHLSCRTIYTQHALRQVHANSTNQILSFTQKKNMYCILCSFRSCKKKIEKRFEHW